MMHIIWIMLLCALGALAAIIVLAIWVASMVIDDEHLMLEHLERKHGLRDNE